MKTNSLIGALLLVIGLSGGGRADTTTTQLTSLIKKAAPSIVTVKLVTKTEYRSGGQSQDSESRMEMQGVVVDSSGLIMISNLPLSPTRLIAMLGGGDDAPNIRVIPTDIKIIFDQDEKEYQATLVATDTKLDLAFLKMESTAGRKLEPVSFDEETLPILGQQVVSISRLKKGYDYAAVFETARISGQIAKPRRAWVLDGSVSQLGLPIYSTEGKVLGVLTTIQSGVKEEDSDSGGFGSMMSVVGRQSPIRPFVVSAGAVASTIKQAKIQAAKSKASHGKKPTPAQTEIKPPVTKPGEGTKPVK